MDKASERVNAYLGITVSEFNAENRKLITYTSCLPPDSRQALIQMEDHFRKNYNIRTFTDE
jgi:hypothetical protein